MEKVDYIQSLTEEDKVRICFRENRGKIEHFVVQYRALIRGRWFTIMRIDTCHGYPHKHTFYLHNRQYVIKLSGDMNIVFTESVKFVKENFPKIKENFLNAN
jgi:hypothetical protein